MMETKANHEPLLTAQAVARWLGVAVTTVYLAAADGRLPHVRFWKGRRRAIIRFRASEIERFVRERSVTSTAPEIRQ